MSGVAIYMEGGGDSNNTKSEIRVGMNEFLVELKEAARKKCWNWKLVCCGSRGEAYKAYCNARNSNDHSIVFLLVDSEDPVSGRAHHHLKKRDKWNLSNEEENEIHLMAQTMETWIVADTDALRKYYGQNFASGALPKRKDLETVSKKDIARALIKATEKSTKGKYHKIHHASVLLKEIDPQVVQKRCSFCKRLFKLLDQSISED